MARGGRDADLRLRGMGLLPRFVLSMTMALTLVMAIAGYTLYRSSTTIADNILNDTIVRSVVLTAQHPQIEQRGEGKAREVKKVQIFEIAYGDELEKHGSLYRIENLKERGGEDTRLLVPAAVPTTGRALLQLIIAIMIVVVLVGAGVALWVANQVTRPIGEIIDDIRQVARGNLKHRIRARGGGEIELLARTIDRMTAELEEAREAELELSIRKREMELAGEVREALLPLTTPLVPGYDLGASQLSSAQIGGDFHDYLENADGSIGLLVCDVSGTGIPASLVGATARSTLRAALLDSGDVMESLRGVNRELARDVRRGMFVTALYVLVDPAAHRARVWCAGHKLPLLRFTAADGKLRAVHPEGIALGFDKGPVFDRSLQVQELDLAPGDRLLVANTGPVQVVDPEGEELGEKGFYALVRRHAELPTVKLLKGLRQTLEDHAGGEPFPRDISLVTIARES